MKKFNSQPSAKQSIKRRKIGLYDACYSKYFWSIGDDIVELSTENESLKNQLGDYDEKWLQESEAKLLKQMDVEKITNLIMSRMEKQIKNKNKGLILIMIIYGETNFITLFPEKIEFKVLILTI